MTSIVTPTTPGTIKATTLGNFIFQLALWGLSQQKNSTKNPNTLDYLSLTIDNEKAYQSYPDANGGSASIDIGFPCKWLAVPTTSDKSLIIPDYLTSSGFTAGSGGIPTFSSTSWCQSLCEAVVLLQLLQNNPTKNPYGLQPVSSWGLASQQETVNNSLFSASLELPLIQTFDSTTGNIVLSGSSPMGTLI